MMTMDAEKNLSQKLSDDIIQYILTNQLQSGDKLPNELILSKQLGAGRSSVREAMKLLASRNIVNIRQGSGTYVSERQGISEDPLGLMFIQDKHKLAQDLLDIRFLLEPPIAAMAAKNAGEEDIRTLRLLCSDIEQKIRAGEQYVQEDIAFHTTIAKSSRNLVIPRLIPVINTSIELFIDITNSSLKEETITGHQDLVTAISSHDPTAAQDFMYLHLVYNRRCIARVEDNWGIVK